MPNHNDTPTHSITEKELLVYNKAPSSVQDEHLPLQLCGHWVVGTSLEVPWPRGVSCDCVGIAGSFGRRLSTGACDDEGEELVRALRHHGLCTMTKVLHWDLLGFVSKLSNGRAAAAPSLQFQTSSASSDVLSEAKVALKINYPTLEIFCSVALSAAPAPGANSICWWEPDG